MTCAVEGCGRYFSMRALTTTLALQLTSKHKVTKDSELNFRRNSGRLISYSRLNNNKRARLSLRLVNWIVDSKQSIAVVENKCFIHFIKEANSGYDFPSGRTIEREVNGGHNETNPNLVNQWRCCTQL